MGHYTTFPHFQISLFNFITSSPQIFFYLRLFAYTHCNLHNMKLELVISLIVLAVVSAGRSPANRRGLFGVVSSSHRTSTSCTDMLHNIRGGAVHESSTLSDLESKIQSAALQNKLTVIDFTATW